jgi:hypothetical protein
VVLNADVNGAFNILNKVSPGVQALGVEAILPGLPSLPDTTGGIGKALQIDPTHVAKFDLNWSIVMQDGCTGQR